MINEYKAREIFKTLKKFDFHQLFEFAEEDNADIFRLYYDVDGITITMIIALEDSDWSLIRYYIAECHNPVKKEQILDLLNELNKQRRCKFYIDKNNNIVSDIQFPSTNENFDSDLLIHTAIMFLKGIEKNDYAKIMRVLWN